MRTLNNSLNSTDTSKATQKRQDSQPEPLKVLTAVFFFEGSLGLLGFLGAYFVDVDLWSYIQWHQVEDILWGLGLSGVFFVIFLLLYHSPFHFAKKAKTKLENNIIHFFAGFGFFHILAAALVSGFAEEILFRGFFHHAIQGGSSEKANVLAALFVSNVIFGLLHWITPFYAVYAGILGVLLGLSGLYFDNLLTPIVAHAAYNFLVLYYYFYKRKWRLSGSNR